jgi:hypothetical protein
MGKTTKAKAKLTPADIQKLNKLPAAANKLPSPTERRRVEGLCHDRFNWSDGGHWIGTGPEPNCFQSSTIRGTQTTIYEFPTDAAAFKWNAEWEKAILYAGHLVTAVVTTIVTLKTGGVGGILVGTIAAITKDELQARVEYPKVARGWKYVLTFSHSYRWSPHPWGEKGFSQEVSGASFDQQGKKHYQSVNRVDFDFEQFPESLAIDLASMPSKTSKVIYS